MSEICANRQAWVVKSILNNFMHRNAESLEIGVTPSGCFKMEQPAQLVIQYGAYKAEIVLCPFQGLLTFHHGRDIGPFGAEQGVRGSQSATNNAGLCQKGPVPSGCAPKNATRRCATR